MSSLTRLRRTIYRFGFRLHHTNVQQARGRASVHGRVNLPHARHLSYTNFRLRCRTVKCAQPITDHVPREYRPVEFRFIFLFCRVRLQKIKTETKNVEKKFYVFPVNAIKLFRLKPCMRTRIVRIVRENLSNELCGDVDVNFRLLSSSSSRLISENSAP